MTALERRVIVVLGHSDGGRNALHPICAARLRHAEAIASEHDLVVLSGWARVPGTRSEAELMAAAWKGAATELIVDPDASTTMGNAVNAGSDIVRSGAQEVLVVTSKWHGPRAWAVFRWVLRQSGVRVVSSWTPEHNGGVRHWAREVVCWVFLPVQLARPGSRPSAGRLST